MDKKKNFNQAQDRQPFFENNDYGFCLLLRRVENSVHRKIVFIIPFSFKTSRPWTFNLPKMLNIYPRLIFFFFI